MNGKLRSAHQLERVGKKFGAAEIARFQCKQLSPFFAPTASKAGTPAAISAPTRNPGIPAIDHSA
jgi:hypothetical protein